MYKKMPSFSKHLFGDSSSNQHHSKQRTVSINSTATNNTSVAPNVASSGHSHHSWNASSPSYNNHHRHLFPYQPKRKKNRFLHSSSSRFKNSGFSKSRSSPTIPLPSTPIMSTPPPNHKNMSDDIMEDIVQSPPEPIRNTHKDVLHGRFQPIPTVSKSPTHQRKTRNSKDLPNAKKLFEDKENDGGEKFLPSQARSPRRALVAPPPPPPTPIHPKGISDKYAVPERNISCKNSHSQYPPILPSPSNVGAPQLGVYRMKLPPNLLILLEPILSLCHQSIHSWKTDLYSLTRQDVPLRNVPRAYELAKPIISYMKQWLFHFYMKDIIHPYNDTKKRHNVIHFDKNQPHILKYSVQDGHTGVRLHHDRSDFTVSLMMSRPEDYTGGGTYFPEIGSTIMLDYGEFILHPGQCK